METRLIYEGGELAAQGPGGRYAVRAYGPAGDEGGPEDEAEARHGAPHHPVETVSFRAVETEPEQQTYYGFAVYKVTPGGRLAWWTDWPFLGSAIAAALAMAEGAGVDEGADVEELSSVDRARVEQMRDGAAECDNCSWRGVPHPVVGDLAARVEPGGVVPAGECPECGALAYPARDRMAELVGALRILVEAEATIREALRR